MNTMNIKVNIDGFTIDGCCNMSVKIERKPRLHSLCVVCFLAVIHALYDTDKQALLGALEVFFKSELEQDNEE